MKMVTLTRSFSVVFWDDYMMLVRWHLWPTLAQVCKGCMRWNCTIRNPIGWLGNLIGIPGTLLVASHSAWAGWAFPVMLLGALCWLARGIKTKDTPLIVVQAVYCLVNFYGIWNWLIPHS